MPASLFTGEEGDRFIITTLSGGWGEKVSAGTTMPVSSFTVKTVPPAALVPPREPSACPLPFPLQAGSGRRRHRYIPAPSPHTPKLLRAITTAALALPGPPPLPQPPRCGQGEPGARRGQRQRAPDRAGARGTLGVLRSVPAPGTSTAREPAPRRHTRIHAYSRAVSIHILAHRPLLPPPHPELPESLRGPSDRRVPPTRARPGREERRAGPTAARLPAPAEAARAGRGAEPEFRKRRGWLSSMKSYS